MVAIRVQPGNKLSCSRVRAVHSVVFRLGAAAESSTGNVVFSFLFLNECPVPVSKIVQSLGLIHIDYGKLQHMWVVSPVSGLFPL